jgi:hypothetical protein
MTDNARKVNLIAHRISFLMEHQTILPDLKDLVEELYPDVHDGDREHPSYMLGAYDALNGLLTALQEKGE